MTNILNEQQKQLYKIINSKHHEYVYYKYIKRSETYIEDLLEKIYEIEEILSIESLNFETNLNSIFKFHI